MKKTISIIETYPIAGETKYMGATTEYGDHTIIYYSDGYSPDFGFPVKFKNNKLNTAVIGMSCIYQIENRKTYNVTFNDDENSNDKGIKVSFQEAKDYIEAWNGTNQSYFADYKGGTVSVVCNETGETLYSEKVF